jgi:hypothetical protein
MNRLRFPQTWIIQAQVPNYLLDVDGEKTNQKNVPYAEKAMPIKLSWTDTSELSIRTKQRNMPFPSSDSSALIVRGTLLGKTISFVTVSGSMDWQNNKRG